MFIRKSRVAVNIVSLIFNEAKNLFFYSLGLSNFQSRYKEIHDYLGFLTFDLQADLTPLFNWNVKQLFLYLTAEYETRNNVVNQVVLWDKIIQRGENAILDYRSMNTKYYFWDDGNGLK